MKKLNLYLFFFLISSSTCFSQKETTKAVITKSRAELLKNKVEGEFSFVLPKNTTADEVMRNSSFYKSYFTVIFNSSTKEAIIKMLTNDENSRHIISRFLTSFEIESVQSEGKFYSIEEFYDQFLK